MGLDLPCPLNPALTCRAILIASLTGRATHTSPHVRPALHWRRMHGSVARSKSGMIHLNHLEGIYLAGATGSLIPPWCCTNL